MTAVVTGRRRLMADGRETALNPAVEGRGDTADHGQGMAFVIGILQAAGYRCSGPTCSSSSRWLRPVWVRLRLGEGGKRQHELPCLASKGDETVMLVERFRLVILGIDH